MTDIRELSTPERRANWVARLRAYYATKKKLLKEGKCVEAIEARIVALKADLEKLGGEGRTK